MIQRNIMKKEKVEQSEMVSEWDQTGDLIKELKDDYLITYHEIILNTYTVRSRYDS